MQEIVLFVSIVKPFIHGEKTFQSWTGYLSTGTALCGAMKWIGGSEVMIELWIVVILCWLSIIVGMVLLYFLGVQDGFIDKEKFIKLLRDEL